MKRLLVPIAVLLVVLLFICVPVLDAQKGPPKPTPPPPSSDGSGGAGDEKQDVPPTPVPAEKPTVLPTPLPTKPPPPPTRTPVPAEPTNTLPARTKAAASPMPTPSPTPASLMITGQVFDDRDGDGMRNVDEPGVAGVPVTVDGAVVGVTGPDGRFSVPAAHRKVLLSIVPPEGWQWNGSPFLLLDEEENDVALSLALRRLDSGTASATFTPIVGNVVLAVASLAALVFVGLASLMQAAATRSLERAYRQHASLELEHLQAQHVNQRRAELGDLLRERPNAGWREVLHQVLADALPAAAIAASTDEWVAAIDVSASPPSFTVTRQDEERGDTYTFTVAPGSVRRGKLTKRNLFETAILRNRVIPLDASLAPTARVEVQAVWQHLMDQRGLDQRMLPRQAAWYLVIRRN